MWVIYPMRPTFNVNNNPSEIRYLGVCTQEKAPPQEAKEPGLQGTATHFFFSHAIIKLKSIIPFDNTMR